MSTKQTQFRKRPTPYSQAYLSSEHLIVSVKEARKLLGKQFSYLSDDEVEKMIVLLDNIARGFIQSKVPQL